MAPKRRFIHGDDLLYRFFEELLRENDPALAAVPARMLRTMGIWLPVRVYEFWPVLLPWVVRDPTCRRSGPDGQDEWSSPNVQGYLRDDNSLIKSLTRSLDIRAGDRRYLHGARMGTEFVAAHIWRVCRTPGMLTTRHPLLNSFVPNLVWLPGQVAKLTDREGSLVQRTLQAMSWQVYRAAPVAPELQNIVHAVWELLPEPDIELPPINVDEFNWFVPTERFFQMRRKRLTAVVEGLRDLEAGRDLAAKVVTTRYTDGLPLVDPALRSDLLRKLTHFLTDVPAEHGAHRSGEL